MKRPDDLSGLVQMSIELCRALEGLPKEDLGEAVGEGLRSGRDAAERLGDLDRTVPALAEGCDERGGVLIDNLALACRELGRRYLGHVEHVVRR